MAVILDFIPLIITLKRKKEYRERYVRKKYKMATGITIFYSLINLVAVCFFYYSTKDLQHIGWFSALHILISILLSTFLFNVNPKNILRHNKVRERYGFEYGVIVENVLVNDINVLDEGEKVQILEKFNGSVLVRKGNGDEYSIAKSMVAIKIF